MYITYFSIFPWSYKLLAFVTFIFCRKKSSNTNIPCAFLQQLCLPQRFNTKNYCNQRNAFEFDQGSLNFLPLALQIRWFLAAHINFKFQIPLWRTPNSARTQWSVASPLESNLWNGFCQNETDKKKTEIRDFGWSIPSILECHCQTHEQL